MRNYFVNKYRISEQFFSIQGEGYYAGTPSLWTRTFGCNLKCPGFPCDSEYSWNGDFIDDTTSLTATEVVDNLMQMLVTDSNPEGYIRHPHTNQVFHFVFTGGEPLLPKYQKLICEVIDILKTHPKMNDDICLTIETNGTQPLSVDLQSRLSRLDALLSISPKLKSVSGEDAIDLNVLEGLAKETFCQLKFVCDNSIECEHELDSIVAKLSGNFHSCMWVMPKGETREDNLSIAPVVEKYQAKGFKIATRNHTYIWSNDKGR